jgi:uncharacterized membrane protein YgdD (TMEM256/DUF423 family)
MIAIILGAFHALKKFAVEQLATFETGVYQMYHVVLLFIGLYDELTDAVKKNNLLFSTSGDFILWFDLFIGYK